MNFQKKSNYLKTISEITDVILAEEINFLDLSTSLSQLKSIFIEVSELDTSSPEYKEDIYHSNGKAIGTEWAAMCVNDLFRTKRFSKGVFNAVKSLISKKQGKPVTLLYVGPGPFATLVSPLITKFSSKEIQLILVEVNPFTLEALKKTIKNLSIEDYIKEIILGDASQLQLKNTSEIDILLLECLQLALVKEQQVAITYNLIPQLKKDVVLIPEEIKLSIGLINSKKDMERMTNLDENYVSNHYKEINTVFHLNIKEIHKNYLNHLVPIAFPEITTLLTEEDKKNYDQIVIATDITVFGDEKITMNQTSLTMPYKIGETNKIEDKKGLTSKYEISENPSLKINWI